MQDPPRGGYYPAPGSTQQTRQYQYNATNPWQREEKEKEQARRREAARLWRDQQITELGSLPHRTAQQEEQLRALQLERDFQKRAEEAANQQDDDDESNDLDSESAQRVQGLLRMAASQDRNTQQQINQNTLSRVSTNNQSGRGSLTTQSVSSQLQSTSIPLHTATSQQGIQRPTNLYMGQNDSSGHQHQAQNPNAMTQPPISPTYNTSILGQLTNNAKAQAQANEEQDRQRRIDDYKRKQTEFDENQKKREEEIRQQQLHQQQMQQLYQQHQSNIKSQQQLQQQQQLHPGMLRLDNLVINGPESPSSSQNGGDAPPPPERGSSYAVMSQQSSMRSNTSTISNVPIGSHQTCTTKRVSFHDPNANIEQIPRNTPSVTPNTPSSITMDTIREDPNVSGQLLFFSFI